MAVAAPRPQIAAPMSTQPASYSLPGDGADRFALTARTMRGLEEGLAAELETLGAQSVTPQSLAVHFEGDQRMMYAANLYLQTALRIVRPVFRFTIRSQDDFYRLARDCDWSRCFTVRHSFAIDHAVRSPHFNNSQFAAYRLKDAIVDRFRADSGGRPSVNTARPDVRLHLHILKDECTVSLDSSGSSLHRRGYRRDADRAPISEVLAAGLVHLSGWRGEGPLVDPMCGSGAIPLEAALLALGVPPGLTRRGFGFQHWPDFEPELWRRVEAEARERGAENLASRRGRVRVLGADLSEEAIAMARANLQRAGLPAECVKFEPRPFDALRAPDGPPGFLILNPPYGERLQKRRITAFYEHIGDQLKQRWTGYTAWILSANREALKRVGLKAAQKLTLFNGPLECGFHRFELY